MIKEYKGVRIDVGAFFTLDMNDSPAGWDKDAILLADWFVKLDPPADLLNIILEHEYQERKLCMERYPNLPSSDEFSLEWSAEGQSVHDEIVNEDDIQKFKDFMMKKTGREWPIGGCEEVEG